MIRMYNFDKQNRSFTFSKADRILKRPDFIHLSKYGIKIQNKNFVAVFQKGGIDRPRIGITVSKRVGGAVTRNRLKRLVREFFRLHKHLFTGYLDINIIAKKTASQRPSKEIYASLQDILDKMARRNAV